ncbi:venom acid phosphatase Acph-1-like isoform X1 [Colletes gigas]|uniref:venom acid phosphatase Acph-1-like isoform X1 n=1 Tax=Colletes gigas TaxID=935657 RepID=UPI001C9AD0D4|nr:venom acid phosphatase Acph-1-like isoform X1 [Colletes gigas]
MKMTVGVSTIIVIALCIITSVECIPELQLLHIMFAHKTYAPISDIIHSNDTSLPSELTYEYFNSAPLNMPNTGKLNMYNLGVHLREEYNQFLGDLYTVKTMKMHTAEYPLSMMSAQLVNAGLWPPTETQKWDDDINWQPIPMDYISIEKDTLLLGMRCPNFVSEMNRVLNTIQMKETMLHHLPLFDYVSHNSGIEIRKPSEVALLYAALETKADLNQSLPYWAKEIFPDGGLYNMTLLEYDLLSQTHLQRQLNGGTILKEILANSLNYIYGGIPKERKLIIYSGNDRNIVAILKTLDLWSPHIPNEAASVIFEMYYDNETLSHGIKINYYTGIEDDTIPLTLPNCTEICPLQIFLNSFYDVLPENAELLCNWKRTVLLDDVPLLDNALYSRSESHKLTSVIICFSLIIILFLH